MSLANPTELLEAPELAVLALLDETLQQTIYALFAAHPELVSGDSLEGCSSVTPEAWLADAIYNQANALQYAIERYREAIARANNIRNISFELAAE
jgi:hypothetical protein